VGRPRKINPAPTANDLEYHAEIAKARQHFIADDPVVRTLSGKTDSAQLLASLRMEIAKEAASLHFQRIEAEKYGKDTAQTSTRRIDALTRIAHIELEIKKLAPDSVDVHSERFQKIFHMFIGFMRECAQETMPPEVIDLFFNRFSTMMEGWEEKAENLIR
jgi:CelD/BcsL family acetyltransferase involved in cellulose biosynthesis